VSIAGVRVDAIPPWLDTAAAVSLIASALCAATLVVLLIRRPQPMAVMNVVWPITALYLGPIAIWWYWSLARRMSPLPFWKTIIVEATHCGAGCVLGDIVAEFTIARTGFTIAGSTLYAEFLGDYLLAFAFGVAFQYFAIAPMRGLALWPGIVAAIKADGISLTAFEIGLFSLMYAMTLLPFHHHLNPFQPAYWLLMQIGMVVGYATSYPANWFLVRVGIKEPM
jgi:Domain of unknown function (DUF4396)